MKKHAVLAPFRDAKTNKLHQAGDFFAPRDDAQRKRLVEAGCLDSDRVEVAGKPISEMTRAELEAEALALAADAIKSVSEEELRGRLQDQRDREEAETRDLDGRTVDELKAIATEEGVDLTGKTLKADIVAAIVAKREQA